MCTARPKLLQEHLASTCQRGDRTAERSCWVDESRGASSIGGKVHLCDTEEGIVARNTMHNRLVTDAFIPAGGRPNTIDMHNYRHFLTPDGKPSAPLIVEGANLFVTTLAREVLFKEAGVVIVKDSSANKAGVITSSVSPIVSCVSVFMRDKMCHHPLTLDKSLPLSTKSLLPCS